MDDRPPAQSDAEPGAKAPGGGGPGVEVSGEPAQNAETRLITRLVERDALRQPDLARARRVAEASAEALPAVLIRLGVISERDMAETMSEVTGLPLVHSKDFPPEPIINGEVSPRFLKESQAIPLAEEEGGVIVAMANPFDTYVTNALSLACARPIIPRVGLPTEIQDAIERQYGAGRSQMGQIVEGGEELDEVREEDIEHLKDQASEAPVVRIVNLVLQRAAEARASDVHIEPFENSLKVRLRIDGVLREIEGPPSRYSAAVISRVKLMAKLNIAERRLPQDGRIKLRVQGRDLELRVSTVPTLYGESVVMRLLDKESVVLDFDALGFETDTLERFNSILHMPHGIILVTGPTGSGKTTTLYTALDKINSSERKIITIEDPVEYQLEGVNQIQVKPQIGLTFASGLRSIVRQDPDVIMVGEMRDLETARIAVQSALTGHMVLSTLHTNDAAGGVTRLLDMGVEDYLLTSTVNGIVAQRLVRRLCTHCREPYEALPEMIQELGLERFSDARPIMLYRPTGCEECSNTGYRGRMAILEILVMSEKLHRLVLRHADVSEIQRQAIEEGMRSMYEDGLRKAVAGHTTIEEVLRVTEAV